MLNVTGVSEVTDKVYADFIKICNSVLPTKIEEKYITLASALEKYLKEMNEININDEKAINTAIESGKVVSKLSDISRSKLSIISEIKQIIENENIAWEDFERIKWLAIYGKQLEERKNKNEEELVRNEEFTLAKNDESKQLQGTILENVQNVEKALKIINGLNFDGKARLDNLKISGKHMEEINQLNLSNEGKNNAYNLLVEFLRTKQSAFKAIEDFAYHLVEQYNKRQINFDKKLLQEYNLAVMVLTAMDLSDKTFAKSKNFLTIDSRIKPLLTILNLYNNYVETNEIDVETCEKLLSTPMDFDCLSLVNELLEINNENEKNHVK